MEQDWYRLRDPEQTDSPSLMIYPDRVEENIRRMLELAGSPERLMPHVKTHKMGEVVRLQVKQGIRKFKCATIAEAEMAALYGANYILLAHQLPQPKVHRLLDLVHRFPFVHFASLVDNPESALLLERSFAGMNLRARVWIDIDNGMHRSGLSPGEPLRHLHALIGECSSLIFEGLHVYDGHIRDHSFEQRRQHVGRDMEPVEEDRYYLEKQSGSFLPMLAGGTPTFSVHARFPDRICCPGTCLFWDYGYEVLLEEQPFGFAAILLSRIISKPEPGRITLDLGHKAVAAENPPENRIYFLNLSDYLVLGQSEEHLVLQIPLETWEEKKVGDPFYGIPYHICPTVALYDRVQIIREGIPVSEWAVTARGRKISL